METLRIGNITCRVKRSNRRTVGMRSAADGTPEILAPRDISLEELRRICGPYAKKLDDMSAKCRAVNSAREAFTLDYGSCVRVLGGGREIRAGRAEYVSYDDEAFYIPPSLDTDGVRCAVVQAYKLLAENYLTVRVRDISARMGLEPLAVKVNSAKSHWGTCSSKASLNFTWYCMMAPIETVDYIIVHELCHIRHFNHSPQFWEEVAKYCPDYARHKAYLRELGGTIQAERWE